MWMSRIRNAHNGLWACTASWGLRAKVVHWLYVSIIRPSITFATLVWWPGGRTASAKKRLNSWCYGIT
jgi:hypothetical protein